MDRQNVLNASLQFARKAGLFSAARKLTAKVLRVLCYHGFSLDDEHRFLPSMFVSPDTLSSRMRLLCERGYRVIPLDEGVERLKSGTLDPDSVVITTDDGFFNCLSVGAPIFREFDLPSTLYITTYYVKHQTPIYNFLLLNMFLRSNRESVNLAHLAPEVPAEIRVKGSPGTNPEWRAVAKAIDEHYEIGERDEIFDEIGRILDVDYKHLRDSRMYHLLAPHEVTQLEALGVDIQLHTHRHRLPEDESGIAYEIGRNRDILSQLCSSSLDHFCYPSGQWRSAHLPILESLGIKSATTCDIGINRYDVDPLRLYRFLDRDDISELRFEAEISGYMPLLRANVNRFRRAAGNG